MPLPVILFSRGDTFITKKREITVLYEDVKIAMTAGPGLITELADAIADTALWACFNGSIAHTSLYYKLAKPSFWFKDTYKWSISGLAELVNAKYFQRKTDRIRYMGRIRDINLETLYAMVTDHKLNAIGNEILWASIIDLDKNLEFESF